MKIRNCNLGDLMYIHKLICELEECKLDFNKFKTVYESKLDDQQNFYTVAIIDETIAGFVSVKIDYQLHHENKIATIEELVIDNNFRGQGIGTALVDHAKNLALDNECEVVELTSNFKRTRAHQFYENNGFIKTSYKLMIDLKEKN